MAATLACIRFCISATMASFSGVTSGSPRKARASAGVQSTLTLTFIEPSPVSRETSEDGSGVHRLEEVRVVLRLTQLVEQEFDRVLRTHGVQDATKDIGLGQLILRRDQVFLAGAGLQHVDRREDALVGDLAVQHDFR